LKLGDSQVQEMLSRISIKHSKSENRISFQTVIDSKSWKDLNNNNKKGFEINYTVNMPDNNPLELSNKYGRVTMPDYKGDLVLSIGYGRISTGHLLGNNDIDVRYSGNSSFKGIAKGDLSFRYSGGTEIGSAGNIDLSDRYGGVKIGEVKNIDAEIAYSSLKIGTLIQSMELDSRYSGGKIENVKADFKELRISTSYGSYSVGFDSNTNFDFEINARYGSFKNRLSGVDVKREYVKNTSSEYAGTKGQSGKAFVKASASYGSIEFH